MAIIKLKPEVEKVITQIPDWTDAAEIKIDRLEGLTNTNHLVTVDGERYVLRVAGENTIRLGINRQLEIEALLAASKAGIAPQVVVFTLPEGHLVTRYIEGRHWTLEEYRDRANLERLVQTVKRLHALPPVRATFSPFCRVDEYAKQALAMGVPFPSDFDRFLQKRKEIENDQAGDTTPWQRFCHNDLFCVNVLDDGDVRFVDWEFAGVGDIYYDLATLFYAYDSPATLPPELQEFVLESYFGEVSAANWTRLEGMKVMLMFFSAMWGMLQYGMQKEGRVRVIEGFDFREYAEATFEEMRKTI